MTSSSGEAEILATPREPFAGEAGTPLDRAAATAAVPATDRVRATDPSGGDSTGGGGSSAPGTDRQVLLTDKSSTKTTTKSSSGGGSSSGGTLSEAEFKVALAELRHATGTVRSEGGQIADLIGRIGATFEAARGSWQSPSAVSFDTMSTWFTSTSHALEDLLQDMARRMQAAYDNYAAAETANTHNSGG